MKRAIIFIVTIAMLLPVSVFASTETAADCSISAVTTAVTAAGRGGTVNIPACTSTDWATTLTITTGLTIVGAGTDATTINNTQVNGSNWTYPIIYAPDATAEANDETFDISLIKFTTAGGAYQATLKVVVDSTSPIVKNIRIHHNYFDGGTSDPGWMYKAVEFDGAGCGIVDNNTFRNVAKALNSYGTDEGTWNAFYPAPTGSVQNVYFEDNTINNTVNSGSDCCSGVVSSGGGGRVVVRYNTWNGVFGYNLLDAHGNQTSGVVGSLLHEAYGNLVNFSETYKLMDLRGGVGLVFFNQGIKTGSVSSSITIRDEYSDSLAPDVTGTEHVHDSYIFRNLTDSTEIVPSNDIDVDGVIDVNEDYWIYAASFDGTAGVGCGTLAARPATCTAGVGYWATDQSCSDLTDYIGTTPTAPIAGTLYKCTATNTWTSYYEPYAYPHPLRGEASGPWVVTTSVTSPCTASPSSQSIADGSTATINLVVPNGYKHGTTSSGSWSGNTVTTAAITADTTVTLGCETIKIGGVR